MRNTTQHDAPSLDAEREKWPPFGYKHELCAYAGLLILKQGLHPLSGTEKGSSTFPLLIKQIFTQVLITERQDLKEEPGCTCHFSNSNIYSNSQLKKTSRSDKT